MTASFTVHEVNAKVTRGHSQEHCCVREILYDFLSLYFYNKLYLWCFYNHILVENNNFSYACILMLLPQFNHYILAGVK